jgi:hypothetical protein
VQSAAQSFFDEFHTFDGAFAMRSQLCPAEGQSQFFEPLVVASCDSAQPFCALACQSAPSAGLVFPHPLHSILNTNKTNND